MKKYRIENIGCDDTTAGIFEFTEEQANFLNRVFTELNEYSAYCCMPTIHIELAEQGA